MSCRRFTCDDDETELLECASYNKSDEEGNGFRRGCLHGGSFFSQHSNRRKEIIFILKISVAFTDLEKSFSKFNRIKLFAVLAAGDVPDQIVGAICSIKVELSMWLIKHMP